MNRHDIALQKLKKGTVIPATPLALKDDRSFNENGLRLLMRYYLNSGVGGIATAVHTTQFEIRRPEINLYKPVLKTVVEEIARFEEENDIVIVRVAGVCGNTEQAVREAKLAKDYGYDAVLLSPGGLSSLSEDDLLSRTEAVAAVMPVIGFYLQPSVGGRIFTYSYWERLCAIPNVVAIKCASFNRYQTLDVIRAVGLSKQDIALYTGNDDNIVVDLLTQYEIDRNGTPVKVGFRGGLLGHWSVWTKTVVSMFDRIMAEKENTTVPAELLTLAAAVTDANSALFDTAHSFKGCIAGIHEVLRRQGLMENILCLNPDETLSPGQAEEIDRVYRAYPFLNDDAFVQAHLSEWKQSLQ